MITNVALSVQTTLRFLEMPQLSGTPTIAFHFLAACALPRRRVLRECLVILFKKERKVLSGLTYVFCTDEFLLDINQRFLDHDYYTDIITFDLSESKSSIVGEVYVSVDRVRDNAKSLKSRLTDELLRVVFHGALHLCGYKDKSAADIKSMRRAEDRYLKLFHDKCST
jgi:probable rRNA maturation factor